MIRKVVSGRLELTRPALLTEFFESLLAVSRNTKFFL